MRVAGLIVALSFVDAFRRTDHAARGSLWKRFDLTAKRASQIGGLVLEQHRGRYGHWRHGGSILLRQAGRHLDENRHCDSGTCAWLALLLNRQQHFDLYAHSARRAPIGAAGATDAWTTSLRLEQALPQELRRKMTEF